MSESSYNDPKLALNRIYTKRGDQGETSLVNGRSVPKDDLKIEAYGTVDELNSFVGAACVTAEELAPNYPALSELHATLVRVQHELFNLGSVLATDPDEVHPRQPQVGDRDIETLESEIDDRNASLGKLRSFVLPGGCRLNADLHVCRTVCRRAERLCVALSRKEHVPAAALRYLNRLSDAFFVWSRWASQQLDKPEVLWDPNRAASGEKQDEQTAK
jgi:cob(I)alamin adenosyltransferase